MTSFTNELLSAVIVGTIAMGQQLNADANLASSAGQELTENQQSWNGEKDDPAPVEDIPDTKKYYTKHEVQAKISDLADRLSKAGDSDKPAFQAKIQAWSNENSAMDAIGQTQQGSLNSTVQSGSSQLQLDQQNSQNMTTLGSSVNDVKGYFAGLFSQGVGG